MGSDSREGLSAAERKALGVGGNAEGRRTDSIILVHTPGGPASRCSSRSPATATWRSRARAGTRSTRPSPSAARSCSPRRWSTRPGCRSTATSRSASAGSPASSTASAAWRCACKRDIKDAKAHIDLQKGCQTLDGKNALGYVRARYSDPKGDLGPGRAAAPVPRRGHEAGRHPVDGAHPHALVAASRTPRRRGVSSARTPRCLDASRILSTMRKVSSDEALSLVVPLSSTNATTSAGSSVLWDDERAEALFTMLREGDAARGAAGGHRRRAERRVTPPTGTATGRRRHRGGWPSPHRGRVRRIPAARRYTRRRSEARSSPRRTNWRSECDRAARRPARRPGTGRAPGGPGAGFAAARSTAARAPRGARRAVVALVTVPPRRCVGGIADAACGGSTRTSPRSTSRRRSAPTGPRGRSPPKPSTSCSSGRTPARARATTATATTTAPGRQRTPTPTSSCTSRPTARGPRSSRSPATR